MSHVVLRKKKITQFSFYTCFYLNLQLSLYKGMNGNFQTETSLLVILRNNFVCTVHKLSNSVRKNKQKLISYTKH